MGKMTTISTGLSHDKGGDVGEDEDDDCAIRGVSLFSASTMTTKGAIARDSTLSLSLSFEDDLSLHQRRRSREIFDESVVVTIVRYWSFLVTIVSL